MVQDNSAAWEPSKDTDNTFEMVQEINAGSPNIKVMGVGGGGSNAVSRMFKDKLPVVEYFSVNTSKGVRHVTVLQSFNSGNRSIARCVTSDRNSE